MKIAWFFAWADKDMPYVWQKHSLFEARDYMRLLLLTKINNLQATISNQRNQLQEMAEGLLSNIHVDNEVHDIVYAPDLNDERDKLISQFLILSHGPSLFL